MQLDSLTTGDYHVTFLSRHPSDNTLCDDAARWWPLWYEYVLDKINVPVYGARILFGPTRKLDLKKYILWTDSIHLTDPSCFLHGPFNFDTRSDVIKPKQYIALTPLGIPPHSLFRFKYCSSYPFHSYRHHTYSVA